MSIYTKDLIALVQLSAEVGRPARQDERDEDPFSVLPSHDVESQARGASVDQNSTRIPGKEDTVTAIRKEEINHTPTLTGDAGLVPAAAAKRISAASAADRCSPGDVVVAHHAVQDGGKPAWRGGSEGLRVIRAKVVGMAEFSVHVRICCGNRCKGNRRQIY